MSGWPSAPVRSAAVTFHPAWSAAEHEPVRTQFARRVISLEMVVSNCASVIVPDACGAGVALVVGGVVARGAVVVVGATVVSGVVVLGATVVGGAVARGATVVGATVVGGAVARGATVVGVVVVDRAVVVPGATPAGAAELGAIVDGTALEEVSGFVVVEAPLVEDKVVAPL